MQPYQPERHPISGSRVAELTMMERRISLRLLGYWEKLRGRRAMPVEQDINPDDIQDLWEDCLLVHVHDLDKDPDKNDYIYSYMGQSILEVHGDVLPAGGKGSLSALNSVQLLRGCNTVVQTGRPLLEEGEFRNYRNHLVKYRLCLLPLGEGEAVQAIFGGMRFKVFPG